MTTTRVVIDPEGAVWRVRRRWIPHRDGKGVRARFRRKAAGDTLADQPGKQKDRSGWIDAGLEVGGGCSDEWPAALLLTLVAVALVALLAFGPGLVLLGIDLAWLVAVFLGSAFAHFVLRRPWEVEATAPGQRRRWAIRGYRAAGRLRDEVASALETGMPVQAGVELGSVRSDS